MVGVVMDEARSTEALVSAMDACHGRACAAQLELLRFIARADRFEVWRGDGAHDMAHWLWMRYGISDWKARRWIAAGHILAELPRIRAAFVRGDIGIDKVVELTRFATPDTEADLLPWAFRVSSGRIRQKADVLSRRPRADADQADRNRRLQWWYEDEGRTFALATRMPAAEGAVVAKAIEREADRIPVMPDEHPTHDRDARRADALVALASARLADDPDADRATLVIHAPVDAVFAAPPTERVASSRKGCEIEGGGVAAAETVERLACSARLQTVVEDPSGDVVRLGRARRDPPAWMVRQLRYRDGGCTFPACGSRRFAHGHHITWWERGGTTDLSNLTLVCSWHHKLVHEYGWRVHRSRSGRLRWFRPDGKRYRAGPAPPADELDPQDTLPLVAFRSRADTTDAVGIRAGPPPGAA
jgi:Domain of unknown function (DUF222)/HNH endonuclease